MEIIKKVSFYYFIVLILSINIAYATIYDEVNNISLYYTLDDSYVSGNQLLEYNGLLTGYKGTSSSNPGFISQGRNTSFDLSNHSSINIIFNNSFSLSYWIYTNTTSTAYQFMDAGVTATDGFRYLSNGENAFNFVMGTGGANSVPFAFNTGTWQYMTMTYNASNTTFIFYQNGTRVANFKTHLVLSYKNISFGTDKPYGWTFDEIAIYNFTLSDLAAKLLYNASNSSIRPGGIGNIRLLYPVDGTSFYSLTNTTIPLNYSYINYTTVYNCSYSLNGNANVSVPGCYNTTIQPQLGYNTITLYINDSGNLTQSFNRFNFYITVIDNCTNFTAPFMSITLLDEQNKTLLNNTNIQANYIIKSLSNSSYWMNASIESSANPLYMCSNFSSSGYTDLYANATIRYNALDYVTRYHYLQNYNVSQVTNQTFYNLYATESTSFVVSFQDLYYLYIPNALIDLQREYLSDGGIYTSVEHGMTDSSGQTILHLETEDVNYILRVSIDGVIQYITAPSRISCQSTPCVIQLLNNTGNQLTFTDFSYLIYQMTPQTIFYNTQNIYFNFSTKDHTNTNITLIVTKRQYNTTTQLCNISNYATSGSVNCSVGLVFPNSTYSARIYKNNELLGERGYIGIPNSADTFGKDALIYSGMGTLSIVLMLLPSPILMVIGGVLGLFAMSMLNLITIGSFTGVGTAFIWLLCAMGIVVWKMISRRSS